MTNVRTINSFRPIYALCIAIALTISAISSSSAIDRGLPDPRVEDYVGGVEYIIIDTSRTDNKDADLMYVTFYSWDNKDRYDPYRLDDTVFKDLISPGDPTTVSLAKEIAQSLKTHLDSLGHMKDVRVMVRGEDEFDKLVKSDEWEDERSQMRLTFLVGQQRMWVNDHQFFAGAIGVDFNRGVRAPDYKIITERFVPEPFLIDVEKADRKSLKNSIDILTFRIADYLSYKKMKSISNEAKRGEN